MAMERRGVPPNLANGIRAATVVTAARPSARARLQRAARGWGRPSVRPFGRRGFEGGIIATQGQSHPDLFAATFRLVIIAEFGAQPVGFHTHDGIVCRIVIWLAAVNLDRDKALVDLRGLAGGVLRGDEPQELAEAAGI